jgi:hypothetical protein
MELEAAQRHFLDLERQGQPAPANGLAAADMARLRDQVAAARDQLGRVSAGEQSWEAQFGAQLRLMRLGRDLRDLRWNSRFHTPEDLDGLPPESRAYLAALRDRWDSVVPEPAGFDRPQPAGHARPAGDAGPAGTTPGGDDGAKASALQISYQVWGAIKLLGQRTSGDLGAADFATVTGTLQAVENRSAALWKEGDKEVERHWERMFADIEADLHVARAWLPEVRKLLSLMAEGSNSPHMAGAIDSLGRARDSLEGATVGDADSAATAAIAHIAQAIAGLRSYGSEALSVPEPSGAEDIIVEEYRAALQQQVEARVAAAASGR